MSDSSTWPRNTVAEWREWVRWCDEEPNTAEKWAHIFAENSRDVKEFRAFQERRRAERMSGLKSVEQGDVVEGSSLKENT